eukprot:217776_1
MIANDVNRLYQHSFKKLGMIGTNRRDLCRLLNSMMEQNKLMHINMHLPAWNSFLQQYFGIEEPFHSTPKSCVCKLLGVMPTNGSMVVPDVDTFISCCYPLWKMMLFRLMMQPPRWT